MKPKRSLARISFEDEVITRDLRGQTVGSIAISLTKRYATVVSKSEVIAILKRRKQLRCERLVRIAEQAISSGGPNGN